MSPFPSCHQIARKDNLWTCFKVSVAFPLFIPYSEQAIFINFMFRGKNIAPNAKGLSVVEISL